MNDIGPVSKEIRLHAALELARDEAFAPLEYMNRAERRTKQGRKLQAQCVKNLHDAVELILTEFDVDRTAHAQAVRPVWK